MYIKKIVQMSKADNEAEILVSDGVFDILCYVNPLGTIAEHKQITSVYGFMCTEILRPEKDAACIVKLPEYYAYRIVGKIVHKEERIIQLGEIMIHLDTEIPNDMEDGEFVSVAVLRFDAF